jgi:excisionase family DNA binding protein
MTVKELSELLNVSRDTVERAVRELYPVKMTRGKSTILNKEECIKIGEIIRKPGYIKPQSAEVVPQSAEVINRLDRIERIMESVVKSLDVLVKNQLPENQKKQELENPDFKYIEIDKFCMENNIFIDYPTGKKYQAKCIKIGKEKGIPYSGVYKSGYLFKQFRIDVLKEAFIDLL